LYYIALKMLIGDTAKYVGIIIGITFAALIMTQQPGIFVGIMMRTYSFITDAALPDIWVTYPAVKYIDDIQPMQDTQLYRVKSVEGVAWAVPLFKGSIIARGTDGTFQTCNIIGLDDATLIAGPATMLTGRLEDLRQSDAVIVDEVGAKDKLAKKMPDGSKRPLKIGDELELNDNHAVVVGIAKATRTFQSMPIVYTTYSRATIFVPQQREMLSFVLVKAAPGQDLHQLTKRIARDTGLAAHTREDFENLTLDYYLKYTAMPINFGVSVALGFMVGAAIAGQMFYNFTLDNLRQFGALKAMGARDSVLLKMILAQALYVGLVGWGLGVGLAALFGFAVRDSVMAFDIPWQLLLFSGGGVFVIVIFAAFISIRKVIALEPAIVFKS